MDIRPLIKKDSKSVRFRYLADLLSFDVKLVDNPTGINLGLYDGIKLIGFAIGHYTSLFSGDGIYSLDYLAIRPEYHGQGLGRKLIEEFEKQVKEKGYKEIEVGTLWKYGARRFYRKMGYDLWEVDKEFRCSTFRKELK